MLLAAAAATSYAQTTNVTVTVYIPNVTVTWRPVWTVNAYYINATAVEVVAACQALGQCPPLTLHVYDENGTLVLNETVTGQCTGQCTWRYTVVVGKEARVVYGYGGRSFTIVIRAPVAKTPLESFILTAALIGFIASLAVRSDPKLIPVGLIVASIILYAAVIGGYAPPRALIAANLAVIAAVVLILERRGGS